MSRTARSRRNWGKGEVLYVCEHGSWGEDFAVIGRSIDRSESACAMMFSRRSTIHQRACRDEVMGERGGRPAKVAAEIVSPPSRLVGDSFANNVSTRSYGRIGA